MIEQKKIVLMARRLCFILVLGALNSCALFKPAPIKPSSNNNSPFFDNIVISLNSSTPIKNDKEESLLPLGEDLPKENYMSGFQSIEYIPPLVFKYAILLNTEVEKISNQKLIERIHEWWGTPYRYGGTTKSGIDCSALMQVLTAEAYGVKIPRTSSEQANHTMEISKSELKEGDFVFFNTGVGISHVGLYLSNNKFVHASTSAGVTISDLNESYWNKRFVKAGRIRN